MKTMSAPLIVTVDYDGNRDVLFACTRPIPVTRNRWAERDLSWLVDPDGNIVGFECMCFSRNVLDREWLRALPTEPTLYHLGAPDERLTLAEVMPEVWRQAQQRLSAQFGMRRAA